MGRRYHNSRVANYEGRGRGVLDRDTPDIPEEGSTVQNPPNGGCRAWLTVLSCALINGLLGALLLLVFAYCLIDEAMSSDLGISSQTLQEIGMMCITLAQIYTAPSAVFMIFVGYRVTVFIGAITVMVPLIVITYVDGNESLIKFLFYGPFAIGVSFVQLGILVPILEYFTTKRMGALFLSRLGLFFGIAIPLVIITYNLINLNDFTVKWKVYLRVSAGLCAGIGLLGLTLKDLKLTMIDDESATFIQRTFGLVRRDFLKNVMFWITCVVYFFYQWGIAIPRTELRNSLNRLNINDSLWKILFFSLSPAVGLILGMFLSWVFRKLAFKEISRQYGRKKGLNIIFGVLVASTILSSIGSFFAPHVPSAANFEFYSAFSLLYATFIGFCEGVRDSSVPEVFGREHIKIVEGFILTSLGIGEITINEIRGELGTDDWKKLFRYGGGLLLLSSAVTIVAIVANNKARAIRG